MQVINNILSGLSLGKAQAFSNLTLYPLMSKAGVEPDYLVLDDALERKLARVTEVSEGGSVPELVHYAALAKACAETRSEIPPVTKEAYPHRG